MAADDDAGALFQFVPVITSRHLASQRLALWALLGIEAGLGGMLCGFFGIGGTPVLAMALPADAAAVLLEVLGAAWNRAVPLVRARPLTLPGRMVLTGLVFLLVTVMLGLSLALALAVPALTPYLALLLNALGDHALAGLGGWLTRTALGVSDKLLPMFMLSPEERGIPGDCLHILGTVGFALAVAAGVAQVWFAAGFLRIAQSTGSVAITIAVAIYLWDIGRIYRTRRRSAIEVHNRAALGAFGLLALGTALAVSSLGTGRPETGVTVSVFLVVFGWLGGLGLTQLYKIIPFLTWLGRYGSRLGRASVPRVQDLVRERRGGAWFVLYFAATVLAGGFALSGSALGFRTCIALVALATAGLVSEYWRAWRSYYAHAHPSEPAIPPVIAKRGD